MSAIIDVKDLNLWYGSHQALHHVNMEIPANEITALIGNISRQEGADAPYLHLHITLAKAGGQAVGGHLNRAVISATSELFVRKLPGVIGRFADPETGLNLTRFDLD